MLDGAESQPARILRPGLTALQLAMQRRRRAIRSPLGSDPGTLPLNPLARPTSLQWLEYGPETYEVIDPETQGLRRPPCGRLTWINVEGLQNQELLLQLGEVFEIHPLALEDVVVHQRPKLDHYPDNALLVIPMPINPSATRGYEFEQVTLVFGKDYVISFQEGLPGDTFQLVRQQLEHSQSNIRIRGSDYLAYRLLDSIIDHYFPLVDELDERIQACEEEVFGKPGQDVVSKIRQIKRDVSCLDRRIRPLVEGLRGWERSLDHLTAEETRIEIRDCIDHARQLADTLGVQKDMATGLIDDYISLLSFKTNEVMRALTVITLMFAPMTLIAGIYGMNFAHMPELQWPFGYPLALLLMVSAALSFYVLLKRKGWARS